MAKIVTTHTTMTLSREMVIVGEDIREPLMAHHVHGDAVREAVMLVEPGFV